MKRKILSIITAAIITVSMTACGGSQNSSNQADSPNGANMSGVEDGVLTIAMECGYAPYNWLQTDDSNGAVPVSNVEGGYANGYDVMIAKKSAKKMAGNLKLFNLTGVLLCQVFKQELMMLL